MLSYSTYRIILISSLYSTTFVSLFAFFIFFTGYFMGEAPAAPRTAYYFRYSTLKGFFAQDAPGTIGRDFDYVCCAT
jgi:hypothetical protein